MENAFACEIAMQIRGWAVGLSSNRQSICLRDAACQPSVKVLAPYGGWQKNANFPYLSADSG